MLDGVVNIDKPKGMTSHDVVKRVKRIFNANKAGHTGTLDPMATGVLPICLNKWTKRSEEFMIGDKEYSALFLLGTSTDTYDIEGEVVNTRSVPDEVEAMVRDVRKNFLGRIMQRPPYFSAVKYKGKPLYKWAREGRFIDVGPKEVKVGCFEILDVSPPYVEVRISCSKGTYIRSICHDFGEKLGCGATLYSLRRLRSGIFDIGDSVRLDRLESEPGSNLEKFIFTNI